MGIVRKVGIVRENYNQNKANLTGDTYYQVTCEAFGCNSWAVGEDTARLVVYNLNKKLMRKQKT